MNRKQLIAMWCGIVAFALLGTYFEAGGWESMATVVGDIADLLARWLVVVVITGGLIITFADKKDKKPKGDKRQTTKTRSQKTNK